MLKKFALKFVKKLVNYSNINSANSTTSGVMFQPKTPVLLKIFSNIDNDK